MGKLVELNHPLEDGMRAYPGLPSPKIGAFLDHDASRPHYGGQAEFYLGKVDMVCNLGTYLDSPFHRHRDRSDLSQIPLEKVAGVPGSSWMPLRRPIAPSPSIAARRNCGGVPSSSGQGGTGTGERMPTGSRGRISRHRSSIS